MLGSTPRREEGRMHDVIVVGARCAGSPTAMLLAERGFRVLLVDRATFPSDTVSAHYVTLPGVARLARWGLLEAVVGASTPPVRQLTVRLGDVTVRGAPEPLDGVADQYCIRRTVLDTVLVEAAAKAGAEVREGFVVTEVRFDGDRVTGIRGRTPGGAEVVERAAVVVGADGLHSLVAEAVEAPVYAAQPPLTCCAYAYWSGVDLDGAEIHAVDGRAVSAFPTGDGLACVLVQWRADQASAFRRDLDANVVATLRMAPDLAARLGAGARVRPYVATTDVPNFFRAPGGPGWALVGDAGRHRDPFLGHGIADAFHDAELLAQAIDSGLSGAQPLDDALTGYEQTRNETAMAGYELTTRLARLGPPDPHIVARLSSARGSSEQAPAFLGLLAGSVPVSGYFAAACPT
jgi:2-polyprenyl-6-methoxyphenol hydroxylase-like FAD-dependent oxidoreductase